MKKMLKSAKFRKFQQLTNQIGLVHALSMDNLSTPCHCPWTTFGARNLDNCHKLQAYKNRQFFLGGQKKRGGPRGALSTPRRVDAEFFSKLRCNQRFDRPGLLQGKAYRRFHEESKHVNKHTDISNIKRKRATR